MNEEKIKQIAREEILKMLGSASGIPLAIDQAIRGRFLNGASVISSSSKSATSENLQVDEGGASVYQVLKPPDVFLQLEIGATTYYIPVYT